jgi:hypothetical protein
LSSHPDTEIALRLIHGASFSNQARDNFVADMKVLGAWQSRSPLSNKMSLLIVGRYNDAYLLVLPGQRVIVWRHGPGGLFQWKAAGIRGRICSVFASMATPCAGSVIEPNGSLIN